MMHENAIIYFYDWNIMPVDEASSYAFILRGFNDVKFNLEGLDVYQKSKALDYKLLITQHDYTQSMQRVRKVLAMQWFS